MGEAEEDEEKPPFLASSPSTSSDPTLLAGPNDSTNVGSVNLIRKQGSVLPSIETKAGRKRSRGEKIDVIRSSSTTNSEDQRTDRKIVKKDKQQDVRGVWNVDSHLYMWGRASKCIEIFGACTAGRLHPAVKEQINLDQYLVSTDFDSLAEVTPLSFAITVAICVGSSLIGETKIEQECWMRARRQAGLFFDVTDLNVASALQQLAEYAYHHGMEEQKGLYSTLAVAICERLEAYDTGLYVASLIYCYMRSSPATFWTKIRRTSFGQALAASPIFAQQPQQSQPPTTTTTTTTTTTDDIELDALGAGVTVCVAGAFSQIMAHKEDTPRLLALEKLLTSLYDHWVSIRHVFTPGLRFRLDGAFLCALTAVRRTTGDVAGAVTTAILFVERTEDPLWPFAPHLKEGVYNVLKILEETRNLYILHTLLHALQPLHGGTYLDGTLEEFKPYLHYF